MPSSSAWADHPAQRRVHVLRGRGRAMLRREPVVHRHDDRLGVPRHRPAEAVVRIQVAEHEPAAMAEHHRGPRAAAAVRAVDPHRQVAAGPGITGRRRSPRRRGSRRECGGRRSLPAPPAALIVSTAGKPSFMARMNACTPSSMSCTVMHRRTRTVPNLDKCPGHASVTCPLCEAMCGLQVHVDDGQVTDIRGNHDDVWSRGPHLPEGHLAGPSAHRSRPAARNRWSAPRRRSRRRCPGTTHYAEVERVLRPVLDRHGAARRHRVRGQPGRAQPRPGHPYRRAHRHGPGRGHDVVLLARHRRPVAAEPRQRTAVRRHVERADSRRRSHRPPDDPRRESVLRRRARCCRRPTSWAASPRSVAAAAR